MLGRYVLKEVLVPYLVGVLLFVALLTFDLLSSLSGVLLSRGAGVEAIAKLILYRLPWTLSLALPLGLVFAILVGLARLIRGSELKAAYAAGVPPWALLKPLALLALLVSLFNLLNLAELRPRSLEAYDQHLAR
ncbi:MAG: LptF/LptG family permease, partial [Thermus sp.]